MRMPDYITVVDQRFEKDRVVFTLRLSRFWWLRPSFWRYCGRYFRAYFDHTAAIRMSEPLVIRTCNRCGAQPGEKHAVGCAGREVSGRT